jgi:hypothetical protein
VSERLAPDAQASDVRERCQSRSPESGTQCDLPADHPHEAGHEACIKRTPAYVGNVVWSAADRRAAVRTEPEQ